MLHYDVWQNAGGFKSLENYKSNRDEQNWLKK
jgi:hypothetical protein